LGTETKDHKADHRQAPGAGGSLLREVVRHNGWGLKRDNAKEKKDEKNKTKKKRRGMRFKRQKEGEDGQGERQRKIGGRTRKGPKGKKQRSPERRKKIPGEGARGGGLDWIRETALDTESKKPQHGGGSMCVEGGSQIWGVGLWGHRHERYKKKTYGALDRRT